MKLGVQPPLVYCCQFPNTEEEELSGHDKKLKKALEYSDKKARIPLEVNR